MTYAIDSFEVCVVAEVAITLNHHSYFTEAEFPEAGTQNGSICNACFTANMH